MNRVIYKQDNGIVAVVIPTQEALDLYGIEAIAIKDVIPLDRSERHAWTVDDADLTDGIGGVSNEFN